MSRILLNCSHENFIKMKILNTLAVTLSFLLCLVCITATADHRQLLQQLCRMDRNAPELTRLSDAAALIYLLRADGSVQCPLQVAEAILSLEPVIELRGVCSEEAADLIVDFWAKYVNEESELSQYLPRSLRSLFIGYGLQVSKLCKISMMNELARATHLVRITEQDVLMVTRSIVGNERVRKIFDDEPRLEDLLIVIRTDSARNDPDGCERNRMIMPPREKQYFELMREKCLRKFKPIYDSLISPIVRLASIGMNYRGKSVAEPFKLFRHQRIYKDWFNVIVACEAIVKHEPSSIPPETLAAFGDTAMVTILDADDLVELSETTGLMVEASTSVNFLQPPLTNYEVHVRMFDQVIDLNDEYLLKSIERYGHGLEEMTRTKLRLIKKLPSVMKLVFHSNTVQFGLNGNPVFPEQQRQGKLRRLEKVSKKVKKRFTVIGLSLVLATGVALSTGALIALAWPLAKIWIAVGGLIISLIIIGMFVGIALTRD